MRSNAFLPKPVLADHRRHLLRCPEKGCKFCKAADIPLVVRQRTVLYPGATPTYLAIDADALFRVVDATKCPAHPTAKIQASEVQGTFSDLRQCDPRCTSAIGPICICGCGGANHGCAWLEVSQ